MPSVAVVNLKGEGSIVFMPACFPYGSIEHKIIIVCINAASKSYTLKTIQVNCSTIVGLTLMNILKFPITPYHSDTVTIDTIH